jgi:hypothetical protein
MATITIAAITPFEVILLGKTAISFGSQIKVSFFYRNVFFLEIA